MAKQSTKRTHRDEHPNPQQAAGDNRRAGDMDGNASGGNSKSKGAENPADTRTEAWDEEDDEIDGQPGTGQNS